MTIHWTERGQDDLAAIHAFIEADSTHFAAVTVRRLLSAVDRLATTQVTASTTEKRLVLFTPFIDRTDGNLYQAALQSLWHLYGKERGLFQLQDASTKAEPGLGGNAICWKVANPTSDYCVFPVKDEASQKLAALTVWVE